MCGIAGIIHFAGSRSLAETQLKKMSDALIHRGPDDAGTWIDSDESVAFAHRRLAIIDLSAHGHQPMISQDQRYVLIFNGEIYNYKELKKECETLGSHFRTQTDTEVIMECYRHWGVKALSKFRGMWAFALLDRSTKQVLLSRDPFGIKPLYYGLQEGGLYFASETRALNVLSEHFSEKDPITIEMFRESAYIERDEWTFYRYIKRFPHAHYAIIDLQEQNKPLKFQRYWAPNGNVIKNITFNDAANRVRELFEDSVKLHLRSDVPVGSCLSGGIDSSAVVCVGSQMLQDKSFTTFTTHYPHHHNIDESSWAKRVIEKTKATSHFIEPTKESFLQDLDHVLKTQGEPFGSMSIYAQYCVFKKISETNVKVVLDGQGADEMLAGYLGFLPYYFQQLAKNTQMIELGRELYYFRDMNIPNHNVKEHVKNSLKNIFSKAKSSVGTTGLSNPAEIKDELQFRLHKLIPRHKNFEEQLQDLLCDTNIPQLLRYEDRNSMAFSIESRVPFLETELVNFILSLPAKYKIRKGYTKAVFRQAMKGIIPEDIRLRRDKMGFPAPEIQWMKECFNVDVNTTGSKEWRQFILNRWENLTY